jgi:hypothetical protein
MDPERRAPRLGVYTAGFNRVAAELGVELNRGRAGPLLTAARSRTGLRSRAGAGSETGFWTSTRRQAINRAGKSAIWAPT